MGDNPGHAGGAGAAVGAALDPLDHPAAEVLRSLKYGATDDSELVAEAIEGLLGIAHVVTTRIGRESRRPRKYQGSLEDDM
jgi:hypothetical protein